MLYKIVPREKDYQQLLVRVTKEEVHDGKGFEYGWFKEEYIQNLLAIGAVGTDRWSPVFFPEPVRLPRIQIRGAFYNIEFEAEDDTDAFLTFEEYIYKQRESWNMGVYKAGGDTRLRVPEPKPFDLMGELRRRKLCMLPWEDTEKLKRRKKKMARKANTYRGFKKDK